MAKSFRIDVPEKNSSVAGRPHFPLQGAMQLPESHAGGAQTGTSVSLSSPVREPRGDFGLPEDAGPLCITDEIEIADGVGIDKDHSVERRLQQKLMAHPDVRFSSLVVRRIEGGVCLQGVLEYDDSVPDIQSLIRRVVGVDTVLNQLVIRQSGRQERDPSTD